MRPCGSSRILATATVHEFTRRFVAHAHMRPTYVPSPPNYTVWPQPFQLSQSVPLLLPSEFLECLKSTKYPRLCHFSFASILPGVSLFVLVPGCFAVLSGTISMSPFLPPCRWSTLPLGLFYYIAPMDKLPEEIAIAPVVPLSGGPLPPSPPFLANNLFELCPPTPLPRPKISI